MDNNINTVNNGVPVGTIICSACPTPPEGYMICDGRSLSIGDFPDLFAAIGRTYGGAPGSFRLPDLRGLFVRSLSFNGSYDSGRSIGSLQQDAIINHEHNVYYNHNDELWADVVLRTNEEGEHKHNVHYHDINCTRVGSLTNASIEAVGGPFTYWEGITTSTGNHSHTLRLPKLKSGIPMHADGSPMTSSKETRPVNIALPYYIKVV